LKQEAIGQMFVVALTACTAVAIGAMGMRIHTDGEKIAGLKRKVDELERKVQAVQEPEMEALKIKNDEERSKVYMENMWRLKETVKLVEEVTDLESGHAERLVKRACTIAFGSSSGVGK